MRTRFLVVAAALVAGVAAPAVLADGGNGYNSIPHKLPGNVASVGFEATSTSEFGNEITFGNPKKKNTFGKVDVVMSSWGCASGHWYDDTCSTPKGKAGSFSVPITLNIYNAPTGSSDVPGNLITSDTETFTIPYRPSADDTNCTGSDAGKWYDKPSKTCFNGLATTISFDLDPHVTLPDTIVFGIAFNTTHYGYHPIGETAPCYTSSGGCPYDSLNVGLGQDPTDVSAGSNPNPGTVWWNTSFAPNYCDSGAAGFGFFRLDSPGNACWGVNPPYNAAPWYVPAVQFKD